MGFEPTVAINHDSFQDCSVRPLRHASVVSSLSDRTREENALKVGQDLGYTIVLNLMPKAEAAGWQAAIWPLMVAGLLYGLGTFIFVALLKWLGEQGEQVGARVALAALGFCEIAAELTLEHAIHALDLLLLAQLQAIVGGT